jgi:hypothetical protein
LNRLSEAHYALLSAARGKYTQEPMGVPSSTQGSLRLNAPHERMIDDDRIRRRRLFDARTQPNAANYFSPCRTTARAPSSVRNRQAPAQQPSRTVNPATDRAKTTAHGAARHSVAFDERRLFKRRRFANEAQPHTNGAKGTSLKKSARM